MNDYFRTASLSVGYNGKILIHDIEINLRKGEILTLIGPNGAGKSTILKSITRQLSPIHGHVFLDGNDLAHWSGKEFAQRAAVVLTDRIQTELMTCAEVVAMGRYPYTNLFGKLTEHDKTVVYKALERVHALDLAEQDFATLSDGQRQRIMLARAICQEPDIIILDEPTAYLDIRHKIELLDILRTMARTEQITVIMSLHEIDLAMKLSDRILCVKGETIPAFGTPEEIMKKQAVEQLYDMEKGSYNLLFGSVELSPPEGDPEAFVVAGGGFGINVYRLLQKKNIPFASGILFENDVDFQIAEKLSGHIVSVPAFEAMMQDHFDRAAALIARCSRVIDAGTPIGELNRLNGELISLAQRKNIPVERY